ncbi:MAG UNVERIFIED_CONTAM: hypothetical protein LVR29_05970 [Microcystis novacekii LVE1205-3]
MTAPADWSDRIYFSTDEVWNPSSDTLITSEAIATQTPLNAGLSYTVNRTITLPNVASSGSGYLLFVADANANQAESNENNNVRSVPFTLNCAEPDSDGGDGTQFGFPRQYNRCHLDSGQFGTISCECELVRFGLPVR